MEQTVNPGWSKERRRELRRRQTEAERILWERLNNRKCAGIKFRRQVGIGPYIVDFYAHELKLVIEIDGESHSTIDARAYDDERDQYLSALGIKTMRFSNSDIYDNMVRVLTDIEVAAHDLRPAPPRSGGDRGGSD